MNIRISAKLAEHQYQHHHNIIIISIITAYINNMHNNTYYVAGISHYFTFHIHISKYSLSQLYLAECLDPDLMRKIIQRMLPNVSEPTGVRRGKEWGGKFARR